MGANIHTNASAPAQAAAGGAGTVEGSLDLCGAEGIAGWAFNRAQPGRTLEIEVLADGQPVAHGVADLFREDLKTAGFGDGRHGFNIRVPNRLFDGREHTIEVREPLTGRALPGSPRKLFLQASVVPGERDFAGNGCLNPIGSRIFIAGTGRSGTTILHAVLGRHPSVYAVPVESKFMVEGEGLQELVSSLTDSYSVTASHLALRRFEELMRNGILELWRLDTLIGEDTYYGSVNEFIDAIVDYEFNGISMPRMFENREDLLILCRRLVDRMFGTPALQLGKKTWLEKTPSNIIALDFLWDLFPDATVINIKRDPRGVFHSLSRQPWAPSDPNAVASFLGSIYLRWKRLKEAYDFSGRRYIEIELEDFVQRPNEILDEICTTAGIPPFAWNVDDLDREAPDNWKTEMSPESRKICEQRLEPYFALMGYEI